MKKRKIEEISGRDHCPHRIKKNQLSLEKQKIVWVATREIELSKLTGKKVIALVMNAATYDEATDIDYLMTNFD